jgi:hypothetical protein
MKHIRPYLPELRILVPRNIPGMEMGVYPPLPGTVHAHTCNVQVKIPARSETNRRRQRVIAEVQKGVWTISV